MTPETTYKPSWSEHLRCAVGSPCEYGDRRFHALIQASAQIVWVTDPEGQLLEDSPSWREFTGQTYAEFRRSGWLEAVHPDDRERTLFVWRRAVEQKIRYETTYRLRHHSGEWRFTRARGIPVVGRGNEVECWVGLNDDVTDQHDAEVALALSELQFRTLAASVPNLIWIADHAAQVYFWNDQFYAYTGRSPSESMGVRAAEAIADDHRERALAAWMDAVNAGTPLEIEFPLRSRHGDYRWFAARARPLRDETGTTVRWCGSLTDVHDRRQALEDLRAERSAREQFVCSLVHDLKNSFGTSRSAIEQVLDPDANEVERTEFRRVWQNSIARAERMIEDLLDANRVQAGQAHVIRSAEWIELETLADDVVYDVRAMGRVERCLEPGLRVRWSAPDVRRVLENLLTNAFKYGDAGRAVTLTAKSNSNGEWIIVGVHNWGRPIPAEERGQIFGFLQRAGGGRGTVRGWGIGLTLVKGIVEAHGGTVGVTSSQDCGTLFEVRLPRAYDA